MRELAKWDVVILGMQVQDTNPEIFSTLKSINPDIKIIAYLSAMEFPMQNYKILESANGPWHKMYAQINSSWWLKDAQGNIHSIWPGNYSFNVTNFEFNTWLPKFISQELTTRYPWDGIFLDNVLDKINNTNLTNSEWQKGMKKLLENTRKELGNNKIILVNSSSYTKNYINGRLYETWPDKWLGGWTDQMNDYKNLENSILHLPRIVILNPNTDNIGNSNNFQKVRFGLSSTLLENGYFAFDWGTQDHSQLWWYDEYNANLGQPINSAQNLLNTKIVQYESGIWKRDFEYGTVLLNSTNKNQTINLDNTTFTNGSYLRIFDKRGNNKRAGFFAYDLKFRGGVNVACADLNNDGKDEIITGAGPTGGPHVRIYDKIGHLVDPGFFAFDPNSRNGAKVSAIDIDQDREIEILAFLKFPIETFELKITHQKVSGETDEKKLEPEIIKANLIFNNQLIYYTKEGEQLGIGPWPPQVDNKTSVRVIWQITSTPRALKNIKISAQLPENIIYTNKIAVNKGKALNFDNKTRLITWRLDELKLNEQATASFEIEFTPTPKQVDQKIKLLENTFVTGWDSLLNEQTTTYSNNIYSPNIIK